MHASSYKVRRGGGRGEEGGEECEGRRRKQAKEAVKEERSRGKENTKGCMAEHTHETMEMSIAL
eukprot:389393-Hanusia_phi.AAC.1